MRLATPHGSPFILRRGMKPAPQQFFEFDPAGPLSNKLASLIQFELSWNGGVSSPGAKDWANPAQQMEWGSAAGTNHRTVTSPFGGTAMYINSASVNDSLAYNTNLISTSLYTVGARIQFDGSGHGSDTTNHALVRDSGFVNGWGIDGSTGDWQNLTAANRFTNTSMTTFTTWTWVHITGDGTNSNLYLNGKFDSQLGGFSQSIALMDIVIGFPWAVDCLFWWLRPLGPNDIAEHVADPFGAVMRPKILPRMIQPPKYQPNYGFQPMMAA